MSDGSEPLHLAQTKKHIIFFYLKNISAPPETLHMTSGGLGGMFEGGFADTRAKIISLMLIRSRATVSNASRHGERGPSLVWAEINLVLKLIEIQIVLFLCLSYYLNWITAGSTIPKIVIIPPRLKRRIANKKETHPNTFHAFQTAACLLAS